MFIFLSLWLSSMLQRIQEVKYRDFVFFDCSYILNTYHIVDSKYYVNEWMINNLSSEIIGLHYDILCMHIYMFSYIYYQILLHSGKSLYGLREYIHCNKQDVGKNMNVRGAGEVLEELRNMLLETGRKVI